MKNEKLLAAIGEINDKYISEAEPGKAAAKRRKTLRITLGTAAAFLLIAVGAAVLTAVIGNDGRLTPYDYWDSTVVDAMEAATTNQYEKRKLDENICADFAPLPESRNVNEWIAAKDPSFEKRLKTFASSCCSLLKNLFDADFTSGYRIKSDLGNEDGVQLVLSSESWQPLSGDYDNARNTLGIRLTAVYLPESRENLSLMKKYGDLDGVLKMSDTDEETAEKLKGITELLRNSLDERFDGVTVTNKVSAYAVHQDGTKNAEQAQARIMLYDTSTIYNTNDENLGDIDWRDCFYLSISYDDVRIRDIRLEGSITAVKPRSVKREMLTLAEAEEMLNKGWVFGGFGGCPTCRAMQSPISFDNYDGVKFLYIGNSKRCYLPVYAFYKKITPESYENVPDGKALFAITYVPAARLDGIEEFFADLHKYGTFAAMKTARQFEKYGIDINDPLKYLGDELSYLTSMPGFSYVNYNFSVSSEGIPRIDVMISRDEDDVPQPPDKERVQYYAELFRALENAGYKLWGHNSEEKIVRLAPEEFTRGQCLAKKGLRYMEVDIKLNISRNADTKDITCITVSFDLISEAPLSARVQFMGELMYYMYQINGMPSEP